MATLIESLTNLVTPVVGQIAGKLGESEAAVASGVTSSLGSVLGGLLYKTRDATAFGQIFDSISSPPPSANLNGDMQSAIGSLGTTGVGFPSRATQFLNTLFGSHTNLVVDLIGRTAGFKNPISASSLLAFAIPMVLNFIGKRTHEEGLNAGGLTNLLTSERDSIVAAAPPGFMDVLESAPPMPHVEREVPMVPEPADRPYVGDTRTERGGRWLWPAVGVSAALLALIAISVSRPHRHAQRVGTTMPAIDTMTRRPGAVLDTAGGEVSLGVGSLGAYGRRSLPNGVAIYVPANGMESRAIAFIEGSHPTGTHASFDLDRLAFAQGSTQMLPGSREQLHSVAAILRAYPDVTIRIEGYGDNIGSPGPNLKLSQQRANTVKHALEMSGIPSSRMKAEAGGVRNRRVAVEITSPSSR